MSRRRLRGDVPRADLLSGAAATWRLKSTTRHVWEEPDQPGTRERMDGWGGAGHVTLGVKSFQVVGRVPPPSSGWTGGPGLRGSGRTWETGPSEEDGQRSAETQGLREAQGTKIKADQSRTKQRRKQPPEIVPAENTSNKIIKLFGGDRSDG